MPRGGLWSYIIICLAGHAAYNSYELGIRLRLVYPGELMSSTELCVVVLFVYLIKQYSYPGESSDSGRSCGLSQKKQP